MPLVPEPVCRDNHGGQPPLGLESTGISTGTSIVTGKEVEEEVEVSTLEMFPGTEPPAERESMNPKIENEQHSPVAPGVKVARTSGASVGTLLPSNRTEFTVTTYNILAKSLGSNCIPWTMVIRDKTLLRDLESIVQMTWAEWKSKYIAREYVKHFHKNAPSGNVQAMRALWGQSVVESNLDINEALTGITCVGTDRLTYRGTDGKEVECRTLRGLLHEKLPTRLAESVFQNLKATEEHVFSWENRGPRLFRRIQGLNSDIIGLQEYDCHDATARYRGNLHHASTFSEAMKSAGYDGILFRHKGKSDGNGIFWRRDKFCLYAEDTSMMPPPRKQRLPSIWGITRTHNAKTMTLKTKANSHKGKINKSYFTLPSKRRRPKASLSPIQCNSSAQDWQNAMHSLGRQYLSLSIEATQGSATEALATARFVDDVPSALRASVYNLNMGEKWHKKEPVDRRADGESQKQAPLYQESPSSMREDDCRSVGLICLRHLQSNARVWVCVTHLMTTSRDCAKTNAFPGEVRAGELAFIREECGKIISSKDSVIGEAWTKSSAIKPQKTPSIGKRKSGGKKSMKVAPESESLLHSAGKQAPAVLWLGDFNTEPQELAKISAGELQPAHPTVHIPPPKFNTGFDSSSKVLKWCDGENGELGGFALRDAFESIHKFGEGVGKELNYKKDHTLKLLPPTKSRLTRFCRVFRRYKQNQRQQLAMSSTRTGRYSADTVINNEDGLTETSNFTSMNADRCQWIDYMWHSTALQPVWRCVTNNVGDLMPNHTEPSDHVPLTARFKFI